MAESKKQGRDAITRLVDDEAQRKAAKEQAAKDAKTAAEARAKDEDSFENVLVRCSLSIIEAVGPWCDDLEKAGLSPSFRKDLVALNVHHPSKPPFMQIARATFFRDVDPGRWAREYVMIAFASQFNEDLKSGDVVALYSFGAPHDVRWKEHARWPINGFSVDVVDSAMSDIIDLARSSRDRSR